ncbi:MAG: hypothetical protein Q9226_008708 [Calogaya cf. arnoldii]
MASSTTGPDPIDGSTTASLRSIDSSIVPTSTLGTLSQDDRSSIGAIREWQHRLGNNNPGRPHSITSVANPAPPYSEAVDSTLQLPTHRNGDFQSLLSRLAEVADRPTEAASLNEPLAPPNIASGNTTPAPDLPPDADFNPWVAYYSSVVRTLDSNYTADLERLRQKHAQDLALTRHEIDAAYRAQWKAQNRENERIREEAAKARDEEVQRVKAESDARTKELERALIEQADEAHGAKERAVAKARHEVEDLWEKRWRDRIRIDEEEKKRVEMERKKERAAFEREKDLRDAFQRQVKEWMRSHGKETGPESSAVDAPDDSR